MSDNANCEACAMKAACRLQEAKGKIIPNPQGSIFTVDYLHNGHPTQLQGCMVEGGLKPILYQKAKHAGMEKIYNLSWPPTFWMAQLSRQNLQFLGLVIVVLDEPFKEDGNCKIRGLLAPNVYGYDEEDFGLGRVCVGDTRIPVWKNPDGIMPAIVDTFFHSIWNEGVQLPWLSKLGFQTIGDYEKKSLEDPDLWKTLPWPNHRLKTVRGLYETWVHGPLENANATTKRRGK